jgi:hypothetical protein
MIWDRRGGLRARVRGHDASGPADLRWLFLGSTGGAAVLFFPC